MTTSLDSLTASLAERYRIERELGAGGMATVYLARDLRHDRDVAIKVLEPELGAVLGGERFLSEIRTTARLQHPHILPLLDSGDAGGLLYYVMPLATGETLRARLERERQLPIDDALRIAREVADALGYAHSHGIVHRDIKPENILLQGGHALVADFGIALAVTSAAGSRMTQTGLSLGTPQYMSPEQAMGERTIDARSDIYALGAVTYEMLTGEPPFTGASVQAIVAKVLSEKPTPVRTLRDTVPPGIEHAVLAALAKLPADRFASASDFSAALGGAGNVMASYAPSLSPAPVVRGRNGLRLALAGNVLLAAVAVALLLRRAPAEPVSRQSVNLWKRAVPNGLTPGARFVSTQAAIAPDGSSIVYTDSSNGGWMLMRKRREMSSAEPLTGTENGVSPFFSPDGKWIGFVTIDAKLKKVPASGGSPITILETVPTDYHAAAWLDDGTIVFAADKLLRVASTSGSTPRALHLTGIADASGITTIAPLPGNRGIVFTVCPGNCALSTHAYVYDFAADSARPLMSHVAGVWYSPTGHLLYTTLEGGLFAAGFDAKTLALRSDPVPVLDGVLPLGFSIAPSGAILYALAAAGGPEASKLMWVDRQGRAEPFDSSWGGHFDYPALSPDGRSLAVSDRARTTDLWIRRPDGSRQKINGPGTANWRPSWLSDGRSLTYISIGDLDKDVSDVTVYRVGLEAGATPTRILHEHAGAYEAQVSPDSQWLVFRLDEGGTGAGGGTNSNIYARRLSGDTTRVPLAATPAVEMNFRLSPTGKWLAYMSEESGVREIYVASFPDMKTKRIVSRGGGTEPVWARSGRELFFESKGQLAVVSVGAGPELEVSEPRALFSLAGYRRARNHPQYDVAPGDQRFIMIKEPPAPAVIPVVFVDHWFSELLAKVKP
jgi:eukaryotic-like serine/threonine-protein kinase